MDTIKHNRIHGTRALPVWPETRLVAPAPACPWAASGTALQSRSTAAIAPENKDDIHLQERTMRLYRVTWGNSTQIFSFFGFNL